MASSESYHFIETFVFASFHPQKLIFVNITSAYLDCAHNQVLLNITLQTKGRLFPMKTHISKRSRARENADSHDWFLAAVVMRVARVF